MATLHQTRDAAWRADAYSEAPESERSTRFSTPPPTPSTPESLNSFIFTDEHVLNSADIDSTALEVYRVSNGAVDVWKVRTVKAGHWKVKESSGAGLKNGQAEEQGLGTNSGDCMSDLLQSLGTPEDGRRNRFCRGHRVAMMEGKDGFPATRSPGESASKHGSTGVTKVETVQCARAGRSRWARLRGLWCFA